MLSRVIAGGNLPGPRYGLSNVASNISYSAWVASYNGKYVKPQYGNGRIIVVNGTVPFVAGGRYGPCASFSGTSHLVLPTGVGTETDCFGDHDWSMLISFMTPTSLPSVGYDKPIIQATDQQSANSLVGLSFTVGSGPVAYVVFNCRLANSTSAALAIYDFSGNTSLAANTSYDVLVRYRASTKLLSGEVLGTPLSNSTTLADHIIDSIRDPFLIGGSYNQTNGFAGYTGKVEKVTFWNNYRVSDTERTEITDVDPLKDHESPFIEVVEPFENQVHAKNGSGQATCRVSGYWGGGVSTPTTIRYRWNNQAWANASSPTIDGTNKQFQFSFTMIPAGSTPADRQGNLEVEFLDEHNVIGSVFNTGVGFVYGITGQSNATSAITNPQSDLSQINPGVHSCCWMADGSCQFLVETVLGHGVGFGDVGFDGCSTQSAGTGSIYPLVAKLIADRTGWPTMFIMCAQSGALIGDNNTGQGLAGYSPTATRYRYMIKTLYNNTKDRFNYLSGGVTANIMWIGESNAGLNTSSAAFGSELQAFADPLFAATGAKTYINYLEDCVGHTPTQQNNINGGIDIADAATDNVTVFADLKLIVTDDNFHIMIQAKAEQIAALYDERLEALGW